MNYIRSTVEKDDETGNSLYWSNEEGWVEKSCADAYSDDERMLYKILPINSEWRTE